MKIFNFSSKLRFLPPVLAADVLMSSLSTPECKCNGHAQSCHFDWTAWRESGQRSGGACDCLHNTEGRQCQKCKAGFYRDPQRPHTAPDSCKRKTRTNIRATFIVSLMTVNASICGSPTTFTFDILFNIDVCLKGCHVGSLHFRELVCGNPVISQTAKTYLKLFFTIY